MEQNVVLNYVITLLLAAIAFFLKSVHAEIRDHSKILQEHAKALTEFAGEVKQIRFMMIDFKDNQKAFERDQEDHRAAVAETIEIVRGRLHHFANRLQTIYLVAGMNGWKIPAWDRETD